MKTVILGLGNLLMGDDGVGVHAVWALLNSEIPADAEVLDVGTAVLDALPALEKADRIVLIDAVEADGEPGTVYRLPLDWFVTPNRMASLHGLDILRVLALVGSGKRVDPIVIGVEPGHIGWSTSLSPAVAAALPEVLDRVRRELEG